VSFGAVSELPVSSIPFVDSAARIAMRRIGSSVRSETPVRGDSARRYLPPPTATFERLAERRIVRTADDTIDKQPGKVRRTGSVSVPVNFCRPTPHRKSRKQFHRPLPPACEGFLIPVLQTIRRTAKGDGREAWWLPLGRTLRWGEMRQPEPSAALTQSRSRHKAACPQPEPYPGDAFRTRAPGQEEEIGGQAVLAGRRTTVGDQPLAEARNSRTRRRVPLFYEPPQVQTGRRLSVCQVMPTNFQGSARRGRLWNTGLSADGSGETCPPRPIRPVEQDDYRPGAGQAEDSRPIRSEGDDYRPGRRDEC